MSAVSAFPIRNFGTRLYSVQEHRFSFGIVAAVSENNVIGVDGNLPWRLSKDRDRFVALTKNKILIVGRHTFYEAADRSHINHARHCIVVSSTMTPVHVAKSASKYESVPIGISTSFAEALRVAEKLSHESLQPRPRFDDCDHSHTTESTGAPFPNISCWVAGGEQIYREALRCEDAAWLHLTRVHEVVVTNKVSKVACFPLDHEWVSLYDLVSSEDMNDVLPCTIEVYRRREERISQPPPPG
jgi:dihydrofolate reductase